MARVMQNEFPGPGIQAVFTSDLRHWPRDLGIFSSKFSKLGGIQICGKEVLEEPKCFWKHANPLFCLSSLLRVSFYLAWF